MSACASSTKMPLSPAGLVTVAALIEAEPDPEVQADLMRALARTLRPALGRRPR